MAAVSDRLSCPSDRVVGNYHIGVNGNVNDEGTVVNSAADSCHADIIQNYKDMQTLFKEIGQELKNAKANVIGTKIKNKLNKAGQNCIDQSRYCKQREDDCTTLYEFATLEQRVKLLENATIEVSSGK